MISYLIVDDEYIAHDIIKGYCDALPNMKLMKNCYDALEALVYLAENEVDIIFLDLNMPKLKGFEFIKTLSSPPKIIVTTAYKEYALEGYELNITDYLLKPFSFERLLKAVNKAIGSPTSTKPSIVGETPTIEKTIFLRSNKKYIQVAVNNIQFVEAAGNYAKVVLLDETIMIREKISTVLQNLPKERFLQVHKSFIVAIPHIKSIEGNRLCIGEELIPIGKMYKMQVVGLLK